MEDVNEMMLLSIINQDPTENYVVLQGGMDTNHFIPWYNFGFLGIILVLLFSVALINYKKD